MRRSPITAALLLALASSLAACGGGGGGTPSVLPSTQPPTPKSAKVLATFGSSGTTPQGLYKSAISAPMATVVGQIIPTQQLIAYDGNMTGATSGVEAQAVLDTSDGSAVPSPLPAVTWGQSGNPAPIPTTYPNWPVTACSCQQVFNAEVIGNPTKPGQTTISMTSMGATQNLTLLTYHGMTLRSSLDTSNIFNGLTGAMFDANGLSEQADSRADTDVYLDASVSPSQVVFPYGAVAVGYNDMMNIASTAACGTIPTTATDVSVASFNGASPSVFCFRTHDGRTGKWWLFGAADPNADIFVGYMIASSGSFAY